MMAVPLETQKLSSLSVLRTLTGALEQQCQESMHYLQENDEKIQFFSNNSLLIAVCDCFFISVHGEYVQQY